MQSWDIQLQTSQQSEDTPRVRDWQLCQSPWESPWPSHRLKEVADPDVRLFTWAPSHHPQEDMVSFVLQRRNLRPREGSSWANRTEVVKPGFET